MKAATRATQLLVTVATLLLLTAGMISATAETLHETVAAYERGDYAAAFQGFRFHAEQGGPDAAGAQLFLGAMYGMGQGVAKNDAEAVKWLRRAGEQGDAEIQFLLGAMFHKGKVVPRNYAEARIWYLRAAERGNTDAQDNLGRMYHNGEGIPQDYAEAAKWYLRAAAAGDADAQNSLGRMYEYGNGVVRNLVLAHKWFNISVSRFPAAEQDRRAKAVRSRDRVAARLTPAELAKAQQLAREWRPRPFAWAPDGFDFSGLDDYRYLRDEARKSTSRIANLQRALRDLGYDAGPIDGVLGARTKAAIRAFQGDAGLPVTGRLDERLESAMLAALVTADETPAQKPDSPHGSPDLESTGSGFRITAQGHILTNAHVVRGCTEVRVPPAGVVRVVAREDATDLALLRDPAKTVQAFARFRRGRGIRPGADVVVLGYPLRGLLASEANVSTGTISALAGPGDDRRLIQFTAPVQPGNSGGAVLDAAGNAVGVVVSKLDAIQVARATGDIPQNVNFAISAGAARAFLDAEGVPYETSPSDTESGPVGVASTAKTFTVLVECWK